MTLKVHLRLANSPLSPTQRKCVPSFGALAMSSHGPGEAAARFSGVYSSMPMEGLLFTVRSLVVLGKAAGQSVAGFGRLVIGVKFAGGFVAGALSANPRRKHRERFCPFAKCIDETKAVAIGLDGPVFRRGISRVHWGSVGHCPVLYS